MNSCTFWRLEITNLMILRASRMAKKAVFELLYPPHWFHVKSGWQTNFGISTLCGPSSQDLWFSIQSHQGIFQLVPKVSLVLEHPTQNLVLIVPKLSLKNQKSVLPGHGGPKPQDLMLCSISPEHLPTLPSLPTCSIRLLLVLVLFTPHCLEHSDQGPHGDQAHTRSVG